MKVVLVGATGMIGQAVLRECLLNPEVERVLSVVRAGSEVRDPKLRELVQRDVSDLSAVAEEIGGYDACLFCLGVSAAGLSEEAYRRVTYDLTMAVAHTLAAARPGMRFRYVSGAGRTAPSKGG